MIRYCPHCWAENAYEATLCAACGMTLEEAEKDFVARLIDAIGHPEPTRAALASDILGRQLHEARAVDALLARLARQPDSMDVTTAVAEALGQIGAQRAVPALAALLLDGQRPLPARLAAVEALAAIGGVAAQQALVDAATLPQLPHLLRRALGDTQRQTRST
ncbi:MAG: HEAT repeat domain-containing protein [Anaerolinea sp.]|nr:HEAT repeat domain-containing protein [Anaerolinea sp.]